MLEINDLTVAYDHVEVLHNISFQVPDGKIISIIGSNGAGKTTLLNTLSGIVKKQSGSVQLNGRELKDIPHQIVQNGIVQVPEGRKIFTGLTVAENLTIGGYLCSHAEIKEKLNVMYHHFPILGERKKQMAGTLSGGEQQMLAIARGLMSNPRIILLDEPSLGLAPIIVNKVFELILEIRQMGITILLVEQNAQKALKVSDYAYVLENGSLIIHGKPEVLLRSENVKKAYLGEI
jgi:branched-chain amino acid transport system ATP-binding protein